ncbi:hypothetical protein J2Y45_006831 [Dyadobacter sp. BE34]|uniref:Uncharacterized protein n=1 Tax=Dyadobacter fermentans TaxID=94254 RepID=A0ABU1R8U6_9BACT|nr:hypothetical protein [Dyadobacter fermentans]MDR7047497.1 hypothetical protein [Dyadobacter sp. BE242]MDR7201667.1 hypothetical protein [Dyadobacter sp. BE34]MDR7219537.1 hypothetical protein [Dyadobacter sp. BE31]MDR7267340.1 hypothetical protein [Dyadobacter sp. BE32]
MKYLKKTLDVVFKNEISLYKFSNCASTDLSILSLCLGICSREGLCIYDSYRLLGEM